MRGVSVLVASGDNGFGGSWSQDCKSNVATFPASSPWITAVGGTKLKISNNKVIGEVANPLSAGGFSWRNEAPAYQKKAVRNYLTHGLAGSLQVPVSKFHPTGRGYPDISAVSENVVVTCGGGDSPVSGTSAATPIVAGMISSLNDYRASIRGPALGFLNPFLYANPSAFNDITSGNAPGCGFHGWTATHGWDAVGAGSATIHATANANGRGLFVC